MNEKADIKNPAFDTHHMGILILNPKFRIQQALTMENSSNIGNTDILDCIIAGTCQK